MFDQPTESNRIKTSTVKPDEEAHINTLFDPTGNTALTGATLMFEILCVVAQSLSRR